MACKYMYGARVSIQMNSWSNSGWKQQRALYHSRVQSRIIIRLCPGTGPPTNLYHKSRTSARGSRHLRLGSRHLGFLVWWLCPRVIGGSGGVPDSPADRWNNLENCAFNDTSMKFGTRLGHTLRIIFGYRAITDFVKWPPMSTIVHEWNIVQRFFQLPYWNCWYVLKLIFFPKWLPFFIMANIYFPEFSYNAFSV